MSIFSGLGIQDGKERIKEEVLYNLGACFVLVERQINQMLTPFDLNTVKINALLIIKHVGKKRGLPQHEISEKMIVSQGNISRLVDRLEKEGFVARRAGLIRITKQGSDLLNRVWPVYKKEVDNIVSVIPNIDIAFAAVVLSGLREKLQETLK